MAELPLTCGIVLDLDDTLYPERSFHDSGFRWIADRVGLDPDGAEVAAARQALRSKGRPLDLLSAATGIPTETLLNWHRKHPPTISLYPDASRFLQIAQSLNVPLVLLTDGRSVTQRSKIEALGISQLFEAILVSQETGLEKTEVAAFEAAATHMTTADPIAYFGDNPTKDVAGPLSLDWLVFLMRDRGDNVHSQEVLLTGATLLESYDDILFSTPASPVG